MARNIDHVGPYGPIPGQRGIVIVAGARPNFMKVAPIIEALAHLGVQPILVHTGQHYDFEMSEAFFQDLRLPAPNFHLGIGSGSHAEQTARIMLAFEPILQSLKPSMVIVVGDVNSTLACALVARKLNIRVAHVEAGLRSRDRSMPEEVNRLLTDAISDYLFTPSRDADQNLASEGVPPDKIHLVGNVMIDTLRKYEAAARSRCAWRKYGLSPGRYAVLTLHRPSNVDDPGTFSALIHVFSVVQESVPIIFPVHPRTRAKLMQDPIASALRSAPNLLICDPLGYIDFLGLIADARLVLTDSGGLQEETTALNVPCLTLRDNTERPVTVEAGTNRVVGTDPDTILRAVLEVVEGPQRSAAIPPFWDGRAASRIADIVVREYRALTQRCA